MPKFFKCDSSSLWKKNIDFKFNVILIPCIKWNDWHLMKQEEIPNVIEHIKPAIEAMYPPNNPT
jgi:hypothetical protein